MNELHGFTLGGALGVAAFEFAVVGAVAWVLRRRWRSAFGPTLIPAGILALTKIMAAGADPLGMAEYALVSAGVGLLWWTILGWRDGRPKDRDVAR
jgi:hypothetical protein